jgi:hypothetical protein
MRWLLLIFISPTLFSLNHYPAAQDTSRPSVQKPAAELAALEEHYANVLNSGRTEAGLKALAFRNDVRVRQEACSVAEKGADGIVGAQRTGDNYWDVVLDPKALDSEIKRIATAPTAYDHVSVGVWYAASAQYPAGAYLVLIYPEHSAAYEAFWGHFYLTDSFQHITRFDKYWKKRLPPTCRDLK